MLEKELEEYESSKKVKANFQLAVITLSILILTVLFYSESRRLCSLETFYVKIIPIVSGLNILVFFLAIMCLVKGIKLLKLKKTIKIYIPIAISILLILRYLIGIIGKIYLSI